MNNTKELRFLVSSEGGFLVDNNENEIKEFNNVQRYEIFDRITEEYISEFVNFKDNDLRILNDNDLDNKAWNFSNGYRGIECDTLENAKIALNKEINEDINQYKEIFNIK